MKATMPDGTLRPIENCYIRINFRQINISSGNGGGGGSSNINGGGGIGGAGGSSGGSGGGGGGGTVSGGSYTIIMRALPEITDSKGAIYNGEPIMGRANLLETFSHSDSRSISMEVPFFVTEQDDIDRNLNDLRALEAALYPQDGDNDLPFFPPPLCSIKCGRILGDSEICCILKNCSVRFPSDVAWDEDTLLPYKFSVSLQFTVMYRSNDLPGSDRILNFGR